MIAANALRRRAHVLAMMVLVGFGISACDDTPKAANEEMVIAAFAGLGPDYYGQIDETSAVVRPARTLTGDQLLRDGVPLYCVAAKRRGSTFDMSRVFENQKEHQVPCQLSAEADGRDDIYLGGVSRNPSTNTWEP